VQYRQPTLRVGVSSGPISLAGEIWDVGTAVERIFNMKSAPFMQNTNTNCSLGVARLYKISQSISALCWHFLGGVANYRSLAFAVRYVF
jgi:hypothetical protein